jgi:hypothetical protein
VRRWEPDREPDGGKMAVSVGQGEDGWPWGTELGCKINESRS